MTVRDGIVMATILIVVTILSGTIGYLYSDMSTENLRENNLRRIDGLRFGGDYSKPEALEYAEVWDGSGDWVCTNVKGMSYKRCVEVAQHECAHEIWAEICEKDNELCNKGQELLDNYTRENE